MNFVDFTPIINLVLLLVTLLPVLLAVAFSTIVERKGMAALQKRVGPNVVGFDGLLQAIADALKLIVKEFVIPKSANKNLFNYSPIVSLIISLLAWSIIPFYDFNSFSNFNLGVLYIFALSSLHVYGIIMAGWSSNSRYAFLGALRSASQMISYEVSIGLILISILLVTKSFNLAEIVYFQIYSWFIIPFFPIFVLFYISALAETSRTPFDLPEAEGELVAGYNVEYSSSNFALFFISEYANILLMSILIVNFFLGGWLPIGSTFFLNLVSNFGFFWFIDLITLLNDPLLLYLIKIELVFFSFVWVRATLPRYRYDQLMKVGWKLLLPCSIFFLILTLFHIFLIQ